MKLAVYGTLRNGCNRLGRIADTALVFPGHRRFPAMIHREGGEGTTVEIHEIDSETLAAYDRYEGVGAGIYQRTLMKVTMADGTTLEAWVYLAGKKLLAQSASFVTISGGDWFER